MAGELAVAGSPRVTVSLDSLNAAKFTRITRTPRSLDKVMAGIDAALEAGLTPVKVNIVLVRGFNDDEIVDFARLARPKYLPDVDRRQVTIERPTHPIVITNPVQMGADRPRPIPRIYRIDQMENLTGEMVLTHRCTALATVADAVT